MKKSISLILAGIFVIVLGIAGNYDWAEEVLESVPCELYCLIKQDIGGDPSEVAIARRYLDNRKHYDDIASLNGWQ